MNPLDTYPFRWPGQRYDTGHAYHDAVWNGVMDVTEATLEEDRDRRWAMYADPEDDHPPLKAGAIVPMERGELEDRLRFALKPRICFIELQIQPRDLLPWHLMRFGP